MQFKGFISIAVLLFFCNLAIQAQEKKDTSYKFTLIKELPHTSVKDQNRTGTCWSFASSSFIESELLRMGKPEVDLSEMFLVNHCYRDKADRYVRMQGNTNFGSGGLLHDMLYVMKNYGLVPESSYPGLNYGEKKHIHGEVDNLLKNMVVSVVQNKNRKISPVWSTAFQKSADAYFGEIPEEFKYEKKKYSPLTFLSDFCAGINPDDYVEITSFTHHPFYQQFILEVPDNWLWAKLYNVQLNDLQQIIDNALDKGYTVAWAADVSEKGFATSQKGVAVVPEASKADMTDTEISKWEKLSDTEKEKELYKLNKPGKEKVITQELRQGAFDSQETTDDHAMHIIGTAKDQNGTTYCKIKNSWGPYNSHDGYFYASAPYIQYKTTAIMVHKDAVPQELRKKLGF
ncbi:MAG: aminopeptidase [Prolixibacteraceae bacterium]|jgi:bleomycin hydrolase|nr:aminopeptidase [Prolixibacteraceae bacterium]